MTNTNVKIGSKKNTSDRTCRSEGKECEYNNTTECHTCSVYSGNGNFRNKFRSKQ